MRSSIWKAAIGSAAAFVFFLPIVASLAHRHPHSKHAGRHSHGHNLVRKAIAFPAGLHKRDTCTVPSGHNLYHVPGESNNGFALPGDQSCRSGSYCPYACPSGQVMAQWKPGSTYATTDRIAGGLYCDNGIPTKPFPDLPYCVDGTGTVSAVNSCGKVVAFCQTVLPGLENMVIPTAVLDRSVLAVPGPDYWQGTSSHFYINPPGTTIEDACIWSNGSLALGNWAPYVAGANTDTKGLTYVKIAYNPIWTASNLAGDTPGFGLEIICEGSGCNGLPCSINPATDGPGVVKSPDAALGAGGASFCVVTVPKGVSANIHIFNTDGSTGSLNQPTKSSDGYTGSSSKPKSDSALTLSFSQTLETPKTTSLTSSYITNSTAPATSRPALPRVTTVPTILSDSILPPLNLSALSAVASFGSAGGAFHENKTVLQNSTAVNVATPLTRINTTIKSIETAVPPAVYLTSDAAAAEQGGAAVVGLIVAFIAAAALY